MKEKMMSGVEDVAREALAYWFHDVTSSQDVVEVLVEMLNGRGIGTHDNVTIHPNWTWYEFEEEFQLLRPGCLLLTADRSVVSLPGDADLMYPLPYGVFCDGFQEFLDTYYYPEQQVMRGVVDPLLGRYRHDLETLSDGEWREIMKSHDLRNPMTSGRTAVSFGVPALEPWPRAWDSTEKGPRRIL